MCWEVLKGGRSLGAYSKGPTLTNRGWGIRKIKGKVKGDVPGLKPLSFPNVFASLKAHASTQRLDPSETYC